MNGLIAGDSFRMVLVMFGAPMQGDLYTPKKIDSWGSEINYFDQSNEMCNGGICGHYTQMVWRNMKETGCAVASCRKRRCIGMQLPSSGKLFRSEAILSLIFHGLLVFRTSKIENKQFTH